MGTLKLKAVEIHSRWGQGLGLRTGPQTRKGRWREPVLDGRRLLDLPWLQPRLGQSSGLPTATRCSASPLLGPWVEMSC